MYLPRLTARPFSLSFFALSLLLGVCVLTGCGKKEKVSATTFEGDISYDMVCSDDEHRFTISGTEMQEINKKRKFKPTPDGVFFECPKCNLMKAVISSDHPGDEEAK